MIKATHKTDPLVTVLVVTLNKHGFIGKCIESILEQDYPNIELIVIDNGSTPPIDSAFQDNYRSARFIRNQNNLGFAGGNNTGLRIAEGRYIALINDDAIAEPDWIRSLVGAIETNPDAGAVASVVIDGNNPDILDSCGVGIAADGMSRQRFKGRQISDFIPPPETLAFSGCACLLRSEALKQTGLFDESFFAYCEDTDLSLRLAWNGWRIPVAMSAKVKHFYSKTDGAFSLKKVYTVERNHFWVAIKNFPLSLLLVLPFTTLYRCMVQAKLTRHNSLRPFLEQNSTSKLATTILRANISAMAGLPAMLKKRREQLNSARMSTQQMTQLLKQYRISIRQALGE